MGKTKKTLKKRIISIFIRFFNVYNAQKGH